MTERELLEAILETCKWADVLAWHAYDSRRSTPGLPDLILAGKDGVLFRELKTERGHLTEPQRVWLRRLTAAGTNACIWRPRDWPDRILLELHAIGARGLPPSRESVQGCGHITARSWP